MGSMVRSSPSRWSFSRHDRQHQAHQPAARPCAAHPDRGAGRTDPDLPGPDRRRPQGAHRERRQRSGAVPRDRRGAARRRWRAGRRDPAVGRLSAVVKATFEQAAPLEEALLTDLQLEHQLLDRAKYVKVLAEKAGETKVRQLAEKLITAHEATVEWLTVVLAEEALGGPAALQATPLQKVAGGVARAVNAPVRFWANTVNNAVDTVQHAGEETGERLGAVANRASTLSGAVRETLSAGRSAS